jgi:hypothetical protein
MNQTAQQIVDTYAKQLPLPRLYLQGLQCAQIAVSKGKGNWLFVKFGVLGDDGKCLFESPDGKKTLWIPAPIYPNE